MKKIIGIIIMTLLIVTSLPVVSYQNMNNDEISFFDKLFDEYNGDNDYSCCENHIVKYGITSCPGRIMIPDSALIDEVSIGSSSLDLPDYFNWMDYEGQDWTTPIKDQSFPKYCGSCWVFAALGALECVINIAEGIPDLDPDLSEQYVLSCLIRNGCMGGMEYSAFEYIRRNDSRGNYCNGIIPEACFPYMADDAISCDNKSDDWDEYLIPIGDIGTKTGFNQIDEVKLRVMENGPVTAAMLFPLNFSWWYVTNHDPEDYYAYNEGDKSSEGHAVVIVGWKDDPTMTKGGYWIIKNSQGLDGGCGGFFNIEYEAAGILVSSTWVTYDPEDYDWHPTPKAYGPYFGLINEPILFNGETSGEHPPFTYQWNFGDESFSEEQNPSHTYTSEGKYDVILTVTDDQGNTFYDKTYAWIQETNQPPDTPIITDIPEKISPNELFLFNATMYDPDTPIIYYRWKLGDLEKRVWSDPVISSEEKGLWGLIAPDEKGTYSLGIQIKDPYGTESDWATIEISVPKSKQINDFNPWLLRLIQRFPILEFLL